MQLNGDHAIDMCLLDFIRISASYSHFNQFMYLLQNILTQSIILMSLPINTAKVVIDIAVYGADHCL